MQNFREAVKKALQDEAVDESPTTKWDEALGEFAAIISEEPSVVAFVRPGGAPSVRHLVLTPKGRRDQSHILLSCEVSKSHVAVLSGARREFSTIEGFHDFLVKLAEKSAFHETLQTLRGLADQAVVGFLRFGHAKDRSPARDIVVTVPAQEQRRLAEAAEKRSSEPIELHVDLAGLSPLGQGTYDAENQPRWLAAGGYALAITDSELAGPERVRLRGGPKVLDDLE